MINQAAARVHLPETKGESELTRYSLDDRVERRAHWALHADEMPLPVGAPGTTVVAHDVNDALQIRRHLERGNVLGPRFPEHCLAHEILYERVLFSIRHRLIV